MSGSLDDRPGLESALADCDAAVLFLDLAVSVLPEHRGPGLQTFSLTADQLDAIVLAAAQAFEAVRAASFSFHGHYTIGER